MNMEVPVEGVITKPNLVDSSMMDTTVKEEECKPCTELDDAIQPAIPEYEGVAAPEQVKIEVIEAPVSEQRCSKSPVNQTNHILSASKPPSFAVSPSASVESLSAHSRSSKSLSPKFENKLRQGCNVRSPGHSESVDGSSTTMVAVKSESPLLERVVPRVNCPEKIVFCLDLSSEMDNLPFKLGDGSRYPPLSMIKRVIELFVNSKHRIDKRHEFALLVLHESALWVENFTSDPKDICNVLEDINDLKHCDSCDISSLFKAIASKIELPSVQSPDIIPPPYIVRAILIYGRSVVIPEFLQGYEIQKKLCQSHYFFLDMLYVHEQPSAENKCQEIFNFLCDLDTKYTSYVLEVTRNTTKLHNCMAKLLAHPLQRPLQKDTYYKLQVDEDGGDD